MTDRLCNTLSDYAKQTRGKMVGRVEQLLSDCAHPGVIAVRQILFENGPCARVRVQHRILLKSDGPLVKHMIGAKR